ncbi:3-ketoacyl-ACP reductase [Iodidimonas gelatinilytica]|uniref:3-ketoacyl-ACP reductase n=1 Tax=Iodidimonas gelatinilytica TaxID=1236966 RepID=A0A5A7MZ03_9PROT|nr:SDR family oxidoreductase [Iodidimonas gelatinilytica]GEQ97808.1 3-ketoacyl-ACP reductase [Iodidimonas gelatinilytica]GER01242.1 3-ketoacyl-ACP reductase [Iodidimonas gelatinilytica]
MDLHLKGKRALITGATRGIGRATAELLAQEGCHIAFCARSQKAVTEAVSALQSHGVRAYGTAVDISNVAHYRAWLAEAVNDLGGLDIFVPNVSAGGAGGTGDAPWVANFEADLMHTVRGCEALMPHLVKSESPAIVMMGTIAAVETFVAPSSYGAIKAALMTYAKQLGQAVAPHGVRINTVSPGPVYFEGGDWDRVKTEMPDFFKQMEANCVLGRMASPVDVARAVAFLASPMAAMITGTNLIVDGGFTKRVQF